MVTKLGLVHFVGPLEMARERELGQAYYSKWVLILFIVHS